MSQRTRRWIFCFAFVFMTIGSLKNLDGLFEWKDFEYKPKIRLKENVRVFQIESNCGIRHVCPNNSFALFLSTGGSNNKKPRLCVGGKYVIKPITTEEGRGLNGAIIEPNRFDVISVRTFDTYLYNKSKEIASWLHNVLDNDILIFFTSDEASHNLTSNTRTLLNALGSGKIQNLQYRSQWYMITQKKTKGFTTYEKLTYSKKKRWGDNIEIRGCIPNEIPKKNITADEPLQENKKRVKFCEGKKRSDYKGFCSEPRFETIIPALQTNRSLLENPVYSLPIFVFASKNLEVLISCLDNLSHQPGVMVSLVTVLYENNSAELKSLRFRARMPTLYRLVRNQLNKIYRPNNVGIHLRHPFVQKCTEIRANEGLAKIYGMHANKTIFGNTFEERMKYVRDKSEKTFPKKKHVIIIDSEVIPSPDFLFFFAQTYTILKKENTVSAISAWSPNCYSHRGNVNLAYRVQGVPKYSTLIPTFPAKKDLYGDMFVPDVSRVQGSEACHMPSLEPSNWIERPQDLLKNRYYYKLIMLQQLSQVIDVDEIYIMCSPSMFKNETNVVYIESGNKMLPKILKCLGIQNNQYGEYNGIIRLMELLKNDIKTSTQIGLPHMSARSVMYEKIPLPRIPHLRLKKAYTVDTIYTPIDGLKTTYNESFKLPAFEENMNFYINKLPKENREYFRYGKKIRPMKFGETEYTTEYPMKQHPPHTRGVNVEKTTSFPMILLARDEREKLPLTNNFGKYLDIYVSTTKLAHRAFTLREQKGIAMKDIVTTHETMEVSKGRPFGCKFPAFTGQDLDNRDRNMMDKTVFKTEIKPKFIYKKIPKVPNFGSESESQAAYKRPDGYSKSHFRDKFIEYPDGISAPPAKQCLCPPGMYKTELYAINNHTSPQVVV